jgi:signal peptidase II
MTVHGVSKWMTLLAVAGAILAADQASKYLVVSSIPVDRGFPVVAGFVDLVHVRNPGAAFGIMSASAWDFRKLFFVLVSVVALGAILWMIASSDEIDRPLMLGYSLFFGGAVGNLVDRIRFGEVIDFLDIHWGNLHWPAFNVADSALCVAVACFFLHVFLARGRSGTPEV